MPPTSLTTQLRQRADTLEVYLRARALDPDHMAAMSSDGTNVSIGELRDLVRLLRRAADRLSESTDGPIAVDAGSISQPGGVGAQAYQ